MGSVTRPATNAGASSAARGGGTSTQASEVATRLLSPTAAAKAITTAAITAERASAVGVNSEGIRRATAPPTMKASANRRRGVPAPGIRFMSRAYVASANP